MKSFPILLVALLLAAAVAPVFADGEGRSTVTINGRTIEIVGPSTSISSSNDQVTITAGKRVIKLDKNKLNVDGKDYDLPDFKKLTLKVGDAGISAQVDGMDIADLLAGALAVAKKEEGDEGEKPAVDTFPAKEVKSLDLAGLAKKFRIVIDEKAEQVVVERKGENPAAVEAVLEKGVLKVRAKEGLLSLQPKVTIHAPPGLAVHSAGCRGGTIGDTGADFSAQTMGSEKLEVGKVHGADVEIMGSSDVTIAATDGEMLRVHVSGSGTVNIQGGQVKEAELQVTGSGKITCLAAIGKATLSVMGSGELELVEPAQVVDKSVMGSGEIRYIKK